MPLFDLSFVLLHCSALLTAFLFVLVLRMKKKQEIHYICLGLIFCVLIWSAAMIAEAYAVRTIAYNGMIFTNIYFTAVGFVSVFIFFLGKAFASNGSISRAYYLIFIYPLLNAIAIWTNPYHHLYFVRYSLMNNEFVRGILINIQAFIAYPLILIGVTYLLVFSIKNAGFFSRQSFLIAIGTVIPLFVDVAFVFRIASFSMYLEPISFGVAVVCFMLAILKYDFLNIAPIALQTVVDHISDSYIVVDENYNIIDFNRALSQNFQPIVKLRRKMSLWSLVDPMREMSDDHLESFFSCLEQTMRENTTTYCQLHLQGANFDRQFSIDITPILSQKRQRGTIILMKDITELQRSFDLVKLTQAQLLEKEHLVTLGHLVGGIAHNFKTPIMSISGGLEGLTDLIGELDDSVDDPAVNKEDYHEIADDMRVWIEKMRSYCAYMSEIISAVKGQAAQLNSTTTDYFILNELLKRIEILMNHELKKYGCKLNVVCEIEKSLMIKGEVNSLVQVINNLIINSIEAYEGRRGEIDFIIRKEDNSLLLSIRDSASGMSDDVKHRLFREMITTKAKNGTGLGLYMSYSTIVGKFGGKMWFESELGKGTEFHILIPLTA